ncbi:hypothetical protein BLA33_04500 (plasmid) [Borreliella garinii]|uniref:hypothetical protein n=1 Tax=Borreliella garinii TaxID=29519 RepID=UPI0003FF3D89|nr:hypothetical protein [Borreliella garinii]APQ15612.1 hypothetical protein BLA33_04500 [Borreliella garinii]AZA28297.1 hypothetical protein DB281_04400 [Borreliella garinii]KEO61882.1 hypothetical protein DM10_05830 [Borreliella garinii]
MRQLILISFFVLSFNLYSYDLKDDEEIEVKFLYGEIKIGGNLAKDHSVSSVESLIQTAVNKIGSENILSIEHNITFNGVSVMVIYKVKKRS